jgi:hypothetical protein
MKTLFQLKISEAPDHRIIHKPWLYDLRRFKCDWSEGGDEDRWIELELSSHERYVTLKFTGVSDVCVPVNELISSVAIKIIDMSMYIPEVPAPIRVESPGGGGVSFWAKTVCII